MPRVEESVETTTEGNKTIKKTTTKTYHDDGRVETQIRTETTTRERVAASNSPSRAERERKLRAQDDLLEAVADCKNGGSTKFLDEAIRRATASGVDDVDIRHAKKALEQMQEREEWERRNRERETVTERRQVGQPEVSVEETVEGNKTIIKTTTTTHYSDGSSSTQIKTETRTRVQGPSRTHHYTEESSSGRNRTTMPNDFDAPPERHHISKAMDDDLDRITCENGLHRALRGNNYDEIEEWIEKCDRYRKTPQTYELILEAYDKLVELRPGDAVKICNNKYKNLPFMGMKRYIKRNGVSAAEADKPLSKYELDQLAKKHGISFPEDPSVLAGLARQRSMGKY